jgi:hypothetical protein
MDTVDQIVEALQQHLATAEVIDLKIMSKSYREPVGPVTCADGTIISIQAGELLYSTPRSNTGPWSAVEVMMISKVNPTHWDVDGGDVAAFVPIEDVAKEILLRGALALTTG